MCYRRLVVEVLQPEEFRKKLPDDVRGRTGQTVAGLAGRERPISGVTTRGRAQVLWKASKMSKSGELILQGGKEAVDPLEPLSQSSLMHFRSSWLPP